MKKTIVLLLTLVLVIPTIPIAFSDDGHYEPFGTVKYISVAGLTLQKVFQYNATDLLRRTESLKYGGDINAITSDDTYIYAGGTTTLKVYQYWKSNMTKKAETVAYTGIINALAQDSTYIYVAGINTTTGANARVKQYWKSNMTFRAETPTYGGPIYALTQDTNYIYAGGGTVFFVRKYAKSTMTLSASSVSYGGIIYALAANDTYVYAGGATTLTARQYWTSNMTYRTQTASHGGTIFALALNTNYIYTGGATNLTVKQFWLSNMTIKKFSASYGGQINALVQNGSYIYAGGVTTQKVYIYWTSNMTKKAETGGYGGTIQAIDVSDTLGTSSPTTVYVDDDALVGWYDGSHVHTIPEAIANVSRGGLVYIYNGTYKNPTTTAPGPAGSTANVIVYKNITIQGESQVSTILDAQGTSTNLFVYRPGGAVIVEKLRVINWTRRGIAQYMEWFPIIIRNNTVVGPDVAGGNGNCIMFSGNNSLVEYNTCYGTTIANGASGILCYSASNSLIRHNYVRNKVVTDNGIVVCAYYYTLPNYIWNQYASWNSVEYNTIENVSQSGILIAGWVSNITAQHNVIRNCSKGVDVWMYLGSDTTLFKKPKDIRVRYNNVTLSKQNGISILNTLTNIFIENNTVTFSNWSGIYVQSSDVTVANNTVTNNTRCGIENYAPDNLIYNNIFNNTKNAEELKFTEYGSNPLYGQPLGNGSAYYPCVLSDASNFSGHGNNSYYKMWYDDGAQHVTQLLSADGITWNNKYVCTGLAGNVGHPKVVYDSGGFGGTIYYYRLFYSTNVGGSNAITSMKIMDSVDGLAWTNLRSTMQHAANASQKLCGNPSNTWSYQSCGASQVFYNASGTNIGNGTDTKSDDQPWTYQWVMTYDIAKSPASEALALAYSSNGTYFIRYGVGNAQQTVNTTLIAPGGYGTGWDSGTNGYAYHLSMIRYNGKWIGFYSGGISSLYHQGIGYATSTDGLTWTKSLGWVVHKTDGPTWRAGRSYNPTLIANRTGVLFMYMTGDLVASGGRGIGLFIQSAGKWNTTKTLGTNIKGGPYLGGNWWNDYTGVDTTWDGLGDTNIPYNSSIGIPLGGDYHPLAEPSGPSSNTPPSYGTPSPTNGSIGQPLSFTWEIPINDSDGDLISWGMICDGQWSNGINETNGTKQLSLSGLSYSTTYKVWVNATDGTDWTRQWFTFTTKDDRPPYKGFNPHPLNNTIPTNSTTYLNVYNIWLNCTVIDPDADNMSVSFYWGNGTLIGIINNVTNGTTASLFLPDHWHRVIGGHNCTWVTHDVNHTWYVITNDSQLTNQSPTWSFHPCKAWDINVDGRVNALDVSGLITHYRETLIDGSQPWDINEDGKVNALDISSLIAHYRETYY